MDQQMTAVVVIETVLFAMPEPSRANKALEIKELKNDKKMTPFYQS